jgi:pyrimidine-nucleoside phosphorylase
MVKIGASAGRNTSAFITNTNIPLGYAIGNSLEVIEAIDTLKGHGPSDLTEISVALAAEMASLSLGIEFDEAKCRAENALTSGMAFAKFKEWIGAQGGDTSKIDDPVSLLGAKYKLEYKSRGDGFIYEIDAEGVGIASMLLGAGRAKKDDVIDPLAGIELRVSYGDYVKKGDTLALLYSSDASLFESACERLDLSFKLSDEKPSEKALIKKII